MIRFPTLRATTLAAAMALAVLSPEASAQQRRGPGPGARLQDREQLEQRVRARFAEMIQQRLGLSDEQSRRLSDVTESFQERRQRFFQEEQSLRSRRDAVLLDPDPSAEEAAALLNRMADLRQEEARLFREEQEAMLEIIDPVQLVRFHAMREQLAQRIQQLRGGGGPPGPPPGGDGPDGLGSRLPWQ